MKDDDPLIILAIVIITLSFSAALASNIMLKDQNQILRDKLAAAEHKLSQSPSTKEIDTQCSVWLFESNLLKARDRICSGNPPPKLITKIKTK